jgi:Fe2+ or Zn2+ uptake regulation protein
MSLERIQMKQRRGKILKALEVAYPHDLTAVVILSCLQERHIQATGTTVERDLHYLADKGYLTLLEVEDEGEKVLMARLSPKGKDLLDGTIPADPGVEV